MKATYQDLKLLLELGIVDDIHDDMYRGFSQGSISHAELLEWVTPICNKYGIEKWSLNKEGLVDVDGSVNLSGQNLTRLPLRFGKVTDGFWCHNNYLTTLEGAPKKVDSFFDCCNNQLTTLGGAPRLVGYSFYCDNNYLTTLEGAPREVGEDFLCNNNYLTTLDGAPLEVGKSFSCSHNQLTSLEGAPKEVGGSFWCGSNQLTNLEGIGKVRSQIYSDIK